jgi:hypothetical protein
MPEPEPINLADKPLPFDKDKWIGRGRTYPAKPVDVPWELTLYCGHLLEIPANFAKAAFPEVSMTVEKFIALKLLKPSFGLVHIKSDHAYSRLAQNQDAACLLARPIPNQSFVEHMKNGFGQAVLDGNISVEDPTFPSSRLPLWCIQFWINILEVINAQSKWRKSIAWIDKQVARGDSELLQVAHGRVMSLRWNEYTSLPGSAAQATTLVFSRLLSEEHITASLMDMMFSHLSERVEQDMTLDSLVIIETLRFMHDINKAASEADHAKPLTPFLKRLEDRIRSNKSDTLIFPAFLESAKHWLAFKIDFEHGELSYGELQRNIANMKAHKH